jgi:hypothetical protein
VRDTLHENERKWVEEEEEDEERDGDARAWPKERLRWEAVRFGGRGGGVEPPTAWALGAGGVAGRRHGRGEGAEVGVKGEPMGLSYFHTF